MPITATAAVYRRDTYESDGLAIEEVTIDDPTDNEILIRTTATGLCHSDYHVLDGSINAGRGPLVLGHEGAGIVEAVGSGVAYVQPGDHVVTCLSGFCGQCEQCLSGHPNLCPVNPTARPREATPRVSQGGKRVHVFAGLGTFATHMLVHEHSVVKITDEVPAEISCLVGCGVLTGVGAALNAAAVRPGQTVAVFGCGGVGLSIVQGAALAGAAQIIAVDRLSTKLDMARSLGATHTVDSSEHDDPEGVIEAVRGLTGGRGVDHALEAVGLPALVNLAVRTLAVRGTCTIVGVPPDGATFEIPYSAIRPECVVQTCRMGSTRFRQDIPAYLEMYRAGRLPLDQLVSRRAGLDDINDLVAVMARGDEARSVITF